MSMAIRESNGMSLVVCFHCDRPIDTDFKGEGIWTGVDYWCEDCVAEEDNEEVR